MKNSGITNSNSNTTLVNRMLLERGVIVREIGGYGLANHLRVSIGLEEENQLFLEQLGNILNEIS